MTATDLTLPPPARSPVPGRRVLRPSWRLGLLGALGLLAVLSAVRVVTGTDDITSSGQVNAAIGFAVPIGMAALGGLWSERAGVVNIGLEGMMILGTWFGAWAAFQFGDPWFGVLAAVIGGAIGGLLHAVATVTFQVDHIISGVAINILGFGATKYLSSLAFEGTPGGGETQSPRLPSMQRVSFPGADQVLGPLESRHWFLVSDLAGVLRGMTTRVSLLTVVAAILVVLSFFVLWRTPFGLRLRSCGEHPKAAESLGVNVYTYKYAAVVVSGALAGLGGAFLSIVAANIYREGQTAGRGYIGLAAMIFGNWRPGGLAAGSLLFGYTDSLQLRGGGAAVHALLLFVAVLLAGLAVWQLTRQGRPRAALATMVVAAAVYAAFAVTDTVPGEFTSVAPHITTLLVLAVASQRLRMPAADGKIYRRGEES